MKLALLSNVNIDPVVRLLKRTRDVYTNQGYGSAFEEMLNSASALNRYAPDVCFIIADISALTSDCGAIEQFRLAIDSWFDTMNSCIREDRMYFVSDCDFRMPHQRVGFQAGLLPEAEAHWNERLRVLSETYGNVHIFPYRDIVYRLGRDAFYSSKMWYLGKIPFSVAAQKEIAAGVAAFADRLETVPCKVLLLDLDNTLWGGIVGEDGPDGIRLSDHQEGAIYQDVQRAVKRIRETGAILGIVSKNNETDAMEVIGKHPHMVLHADDFAVRRINWLDKADNVRSIADELNIGLDAMVFVDDNPMEREAMKSLLPQVRVPDFPQEIEALPAFMAGLYERYFFKLVVTGEDRKKTEQYLTNAKRAEMQSSAADYAGFLRQLQLKVRALALDESNVERLVQLLGKTNQFNLTTRRYSMADIARMRKDGTHLFYLFSASDKFGEYGIISAVIVSLADIPRIDSFVMSCRVMGKLVENYIVSYLESDLRRRGYTYLEAEYVPSTKNAPVEMLFESLGYTVDSEEQRRKVYRVDLAQTEAHDHYVTDGETEK